MLKLKRKTYRGIIVVCVTACFFVRHLCLEVLNGGETMKFFNKNINKVLSVVLVVVSVLVVLQFVCSNDTLNAGETPTESAMARVNPNIRKIVPTTTVSATTVPVETTTAKPKATKATTQPQTKATKATKATTQPVTTTQATVPFATAIPPKEPVDYQSQWDAGYLVAIDNPDKTYECSKVTLTDEDRDLLERLCMGEFGSGGFIGAALIAQSVKDAMCFDGYPTVASVIENCHYTGSTKIGTNQECIQAVSYIFDENKDAVQHRIMYMYNPDMVQSAFHESQNYILTYQTVRFFDRWGY